MPDPVIMPDPRASLEAMKEHEQEVRYGFLRVRASSWEIPDPVEFIHRAVCVLEVNLTIASMTEAAAELGVRTPADSDREAARICDLAQTISGLDPLRVLSESASLLSSRPARPPSDAPIYDGALERTVGLIAGLVPAFLIEDLERHARQLGLAPLAHRARRAYNALEAFVARNSPGSDRRARVVGLAYAQGRLQLDEVALLLGRSRSDAVAYLDKHGFARACGSIALQEGERAAILRSLRAERLARGGGPAPVDEALVRRDVIASQRIEGIDARPWLPPPT